MDRYAVSDPEGPVWLAWFAGIAIEAQKRTNAKVEFLIDKTKLPDRMRGRINARPGEGAAAHVTRRPGGIQGRFEYRKLPYNYRRIRSDGYTRLGGWWLKGRCFGLGNCVTRYELAFRSALWHR
jgi:hypothetical protein